MKTTKKFKIKNRRKRQYIKRSSPVSELSLSKSSFIKFMPYILMAVGFITTLAITPPTWQTIQPVQPLQPIHPIHITVTRPTITFDGLLNPFRDLLVFFQNIELQLTKQIAIAITFLMTVTMQLLTLIGQGVVAIYHGITILVSDIVFVLTILEKGIVAIFTAIWHMLVAITNAVIAFIAFIAKTIWDALTFALKKIIEGLNIAWYFLMTPFRALAAFYLKLKPYIDFVLNNFKDSAEYLKESMSFIMGGITK